MAAAATVAPIDVSASSANIKSTTVKMSEELLPKNTTALEREVARLSELLKRSECKRLKQKAVYEKSMENLSVRLVEFENSLRREQRSIHGLLKKKDQQIKVREELTKTLQAQLDQQHCRQCGFPKTSSSVETDWQLEIDEERNELIKKLPQLSLPPPDEPPHVGFTNHRPFRPKSKLSPVAEESELTFSSSLRNIHADINPDHFHAVLTASLNVLNDPSEIVPTNSVDDGEKDSEYLHSAGNPKISPIKSTNDSVPTTHTIEDKELFNSMSIPEFAELENMTLVELEDDIHAKYSPPNEATEALVEKGIDYSTTGFVRHKSKMDTIESETFDQPPIVNSPSAPSAKNSSSGKACMPTTCGAMFTQVYPISPLLSLFSEQLGEDIMKLVGDDIRLELSGNVRLNVARPVVDANDRELHNRYADTVVPISRQLIRNSLHQARRELSDIFTNQLVESNNAKKRRHKEKLFIAAEKVTNSVFPGNISEFIVEGKNVRDKNEDLIHDIDQSHDIPQNFDSTHKSHNGVGSGDPDIVSSKDLPDSDMEVSTLVDTILNTVRESVFNELQATALSNGVNNVQIAASDNKARFSEPAQTSETCDNKEETSNVVTTQRIHLPPGEEKVSLMISNDSSVDSANQHVDFIDTPPFLPSQTIITPAETAATVHSTTVKKKKKKKKKKKRNNSIENSHQQQHIQQKQQQSSNPNDNQQLAQQLSGDNPSSSHLNDENDAEEEEEEEEDDDAEEELTVNIHSANQPISEDTFSRPSLISPEEDKYSLLVDEQLDVLDDMSMPDDDDDIDDRGRDNDSTESRNLTAVEGNSNNVVIDQKSTSSSDERHPGKTSTPECLSEYDAVDNNTTTTSTNTVGVAIENSDSNVINGEHSSPFSEDDGITTRM